jgi:multiple sugar transport system ATP-binding protein
VAAFTDCTRRFRLPFARLGANILRMRGGGRGGQVSGRAQPHGSTDANEAGKQAMASVDIRQVDKFFGSVQVLYEVNLGIEDGEFVVLVGPSGCGKSTLLRMIAGLEEISSGEISIGERVVNTVPPKDRDIAMVFQNYALYPHMTVKENMAFSLKLQKAPKAVIEERVGKAAGILGLGELLGRYPRQLSGGQRQRVAMGRAIVRDPQVFLFDEPLSNLDAKLRVQMRTEIKELHQRLRTTSVYVTHDQIEAMTMADRIVVMQLGVVEQVGRPLELYDHPQNLFVAGFIGSPAMNFIKATIKRNGSAAALTIDGTTLPLGPDSGGRDGQKVVYGVRPEHLELAGEGEGMPAEVVVVEPTGAEILVVCRMAGHDIQAVFHERHAFRPGQPIHLRPDPRHLHLFDAESGQRVRG